MEGSKERPSVPGWVFNHVDKLIRIRNNDGIHDPQTGEGTHPAAVVAHYEIIMREFGIDPTATDADEQYFAFRTLHVCAEPEN